MADAKVKSQQQPQQAAAAATGIWKTVKPFVNGGASGMLATCIIQPIDMVKVRLCSTMRLLLPADSRGEELRTGVAAGSDCVRLLARGLDL